jgi:hypothetical protein
MGEIFQNPRRRSSHFILGLKILINSGAVLLAGSGKKCLAFMGSTMRMAPSFRATVCTHASPAIRSCTPLDLIAGVEPDGGGQRQRESHIQSGLLALRTDGLDLQRIGGLLHFF